MARPPKEKVKILKVEKRIIKYKNSKGEMVEQEVEVKIYEEKKYTEDDSLASEILGNTNYESEKDEISSDDDY